jgi:hypothetical protein
LPPGGERGSNNKIWFIACGAIGCFFILIAAIIIVGAAAMAVFSKQDKVSKLEPVDAASSPGKACTVDADCPYPQYCILGKCRPIAKAGESCGVDSDCQAPLFCVGGTCANKPAYGSSVKGTACTSDMDCQPPLYCILNKCASLGNPGDACAKDYDCFSPYVCTAGKCTGKSTGTGIYGSGSTTPGTPCKGDIDCAPPLFCILQTCRYLGKAGDSCAGSADCTMPLVCEGGKCRNLKGGVDVPSVAGTGTVNFPAECKKDEDCKSKGGKLKYCIAYRCMEELSGEGETCQYATDCRTGLFCIVGVCRNEQGGAGNPCRSNDDCKRPYLCVDFACSESQ